MSDINSQGCGLPLSDPGKGNPQLCDTKPGSLRVQTRQVAGLKPAAIRGALILSFSGVLKSLWGGGGPA